MWPALCTSPLILEAFGQLIAGRPFADSLLSTNAGDITVFIPSNVALTIQATNETGGSGRIISDFAQVPVQTGAQPGAGPAVAQGALNGGGPVLRVNARAAPFICAARNNFQADVIRLM